MDNPNPLHVIVAWFERQPIEVQNQAGFLIYTGGVAELVGDDQHDPSSNVGASFLNWLKQKPSGAMATVAKVLLARSTIQFTMIDGFCTEASWEVARQRNEAVLAKAAADEGLANIRRNAEEMIADIPRRSAMFIKSGQDWTENVAPAITDAELRKWEEDTMHAEMQRSFKS